MCSQQCTSTTGQNLGHLKMGTTNTQESADAVLLACGFAEGEGHL